MERSAATTTGVMGRRIVGNHIPDTQFVAAVPKKKKCTDIISLHYYIHFVIVSFMVNVSDFYIVYLLPGDKQSNLSHWQTKEKLIIFSHVVFQTKYSESVPLT